MLIILQADVSTVERPIDDALIRRIADGDMDALRTLYDRVRGGVFGLALSIVKNAHDADDVLQETFLKIYAHAGDYKPQGKPLAWVFTITRHLALDKLRQNSRTQPLDSSLAVDGQAITDADDRLLLEALLGSLPDEEKQFAEKHGISYGKAAFILGLVERAPDLNADKLADYHFAALASVAAQKGVDLHEMVDYDAEDAAWGDLELSLEQLVEQAEQRLGVPLLSPEEVKGLTGFDEEFMSKVVFVKLELSWEGDIPVYQMEFISDEAVYEYAINAIDGSWMETETEKEMNAATQSPPQTIYSTLPGGGTTVTSVRPFATTTAWMDSFIGEEKAKAIALKEREEAGADPTEAKNVTVKLYYNGEKSVYIVTFVIGDVQYCHDIHAVSGDILSVKKTIVTTTTAATTASPYISRALAINRAVLEVDQAVRDNIVISTFYAHLHDEETPPYWRVEFHTDETRFEFKIHAVSGELLPREEIPYPLNP